MAVGTGNYSVDVIQAGDDASAHFKKAAIQANKTSLAQEKGLLEGNRLLVPKTATITQATSQKVNPAGHEIQTDGVGTKVRIYMKAFNSLYESYRTNKTPTKKEQLEATARDLFYRMLLDLYAMNVDDFRHGDIALAVSDILDIDHITLTGEDAEQGEIFCNAFAHAIGRVIETTGIALVAGETAILGDDDKLTGTIENYGGVVEDVLALKQALSRVSDRMDTHSPDVRDLVTKTHHLITKATASQQRQASINRSMGLNLGGSTTGYRNGEKLVPMEAGDVVIALFENKTKKGIISPRANGISAIRKTMENLLGKEWVMKTLQDYFDILESKGTTINPAVKERLSTMGLDTLLWDIATGETTIFNPIIAGTILGGVDGEPMCDISGQIHVTGNPIGKWSDVLGESGFGIDIDYSKSEVEIPQIIEMCMIAEGQDFASGMEKWNMGIPYALVCTPEHAKKLMEAMRKQGYPCEQVGTITEANGQPMITIKYPDGKTFSKAVAEVRG